MSAPAAPNPTVTVLINEWTGQVVERISDFPVRYGQVVEFDGRAWAVVSVAHLSSHYTRATIREVSP